MAHTYLLEIGLEEMPAHVVTPSMNQLQSRVENYLKDQRIEYQTIKAFSTPRRLALKIEGLSDKQPDVDELVKGPAKKIALDDQGNWSKAAIGFTKGQGVSVEDIEFQEVKGTEYVFVNKHTPGESVATVLAGLDQVITAMTFPTLMKWGEYKLDYIRPIHWLVSLLDDAVVPFKILNVTADRLTKGHRFLGHDLELTNAGDYEEALLNDFVIADPKARKAKIKDQIQAIADEHQWQLDWDEELLEEVNNLVEWPTSFAGKFDQQYLVLPEEVLITSMKDNQRFFCVRNQAGQLQPAFIAVRNGNTDHLDNVIKGNERVLVPRLEDAKFFYEEDQKITIDQYVERLNRVSFHDQISSMAEKMARTGVIAMSLAEQLNFSDQEKADLKRAAAIYKFDLTTQMVGEFAELQGIMGEIYAKLAGENETVAAAIREHYMPISAEGALPATKVGALLAIADKLDSIYSFFAVGMIPSGSNDPYALRRQAYGIVRIINDQQWHLPVLDLQPQLPALFTVADLHPKFDIAENNDQVRQFFVDRLKQFFSLQSIRHDIVDAVCASEQPDILAVIDAAQVLVKHQSDDDLKNQMEAITRVIRLAKKEALTTDEVTVKPELFKNPSEQSLFDQFNEFDDQASLNDQFEQLMALEPVISQYFEENMIMDPDEAIRHNRLAQLTLVAQAAGQFGDLDLLIVK
ncbi:glycine--tRNA ligase subunit beta [Limosilactobacillus gastricus]|uniref:Glycine--tRNA ligase beta subunit n=1 Tax=Limosilactobacillus gastricus DSM 16045 TaxID=1423749 RepID=A0A0R1VGU1_9LACO|nr:glycine--tRNA ligase subunit beta [Limosilactobacillus gastricus]KRM01148.1 Glycyl-tRNA synthetase beta subunit [Limosilactobacillus gastricus DSM 16045]QGF40476.1 glycine--tRNA ligase subunit beta [Limosilactobacillus gastricus]